EHGLAGLRWYQLDEFAPDELVAPFVPEPAIRVVDERQRRIRQEPANQLALGVNDALVALFAVALLHLGPAPAHSLEEKVPDQHELDGEDQETAHDIAPVLLEEGESPELDETADRQTQFRDVPALELTPIDDGRVGDVAVRTLVRALAVRDPQRHVGQPLR